MTLCGETLFVAGPPDVFPSAPEGIDDPYYVASFERLREQEAALAGERGGALLAVSTADGQTRAEYSLEAPPEWDGMAAANGRLFLSLTNGTVVCVGPKR